MKAQYRMTHTRKIIPIFLLIISVLVSTFNPGSLSPVQAQQAGTESISGWFHTVWGDGRDGSLVKELHLLNTDDGQSIPLLLDASAVDAAGGLQALDGKQITVHGAWFQQPNAQGVAKTFQVTSIAALPEADAPLAAVSGSQKWITIMCKFQGNASQPNPLSFFQNMYMNAYPGLDHYWREQSYNLINTVGSTASGWYTLPHPRSYYMDVTNTWFDTGQAAVDCTNAANPSVNFSTYSGINLVFNDNLDGPNCCAWGGSWPLALDGPSKTWDITWLPPWAFQNLAVVEHEMGHAFGLPHSSGNYGETYDNEWDVMSDTWANCGNSLDGTYGCLGQHTISYHKDILGWIPAAQKTTVSAGSAKTIVLEQLALPQTSNYKMIKIPIAGSSTRFYTVEARRLTGYDVQLPGSGVIIHEINKSRSDSPAHVIDIDNNFDTGDSGAVWTTGEVFRNNTNKIAVAVLATTSSGFRVHVSSGVNMYYISGNIGVSNVTIKYTGGSTTTDGTGRFMFPVSAGWTGTVTPSKAGYTFSPANRSYSNVTSDKFNQNFTGIQFYSISGDTGVGGVTLDYNYNGAKKATSQGNGNYSFSVPSGWNGIVTPSHACFSFTPANKSYSSLAGNQAAQNYTPSFVNGVGCADIDVNIGDARQGRFGLPQGESTRTNFTSVNNGPVQIVSTNSVPLIAAERLIYKVGGNNVSFTEMMGLPESQLDNVYWLPWYNHNGNDLDTQLRFGNVSESEAIVRLYIGDAEASNCTSTPAQTYPYVLDPGESVRVSCVGVNDGPVRIESTNNVNIVAAERLIYKVGNVATSFTEMMALPEKQLDNEYWLPWYNYSGMDTQLRIANVTEFDAEVKIYIGGQLRETFELPAHTSERKSYLGVNDGPVQIVSTENIVAAERLIYKVGNTATSFTETMALPENQLSMVHWLPWYNHNGNDLDTQLRIGNTTDIDATVQVWIGGELMESFNLPKGETVTKSYVGKNDGPVQIISNQLIVVSERLIYSTSNGATSFSEIVGLPDFLLDSSFWFPWYNNNGVDLDTQLRFGIPN